MLITKFLLRTLPIILLSAAFFFVGLVYFKQQEIRESNKLFAIDWGNNDASLLVRPLWQLEQDAIVDILKAQLKRPRVHCIQLTQNAPSIPPIFEQGTCLNQANFYIQKTPIFYSDQLGKKNIGELVHWIDIDPGNNELREKLLPLLIMLVVLVFVLVICVWVVLQSLILRPLSIVSRSIAAFSQEGRRIPADWESNDELGQLIKKYNQGLQEQAQSEAALKSSVAETHQALQDLQNAQQSLIESEKLASLGGLVAGIAHEINTPVGSSLTVASSLESRAQQFKREIEAGALRKSALLEFIDGVEEACRILLRSLSAAAEQIHNFKQVAVDQTSSQRREFKLKETMQEVLSTLKPTIKKTQITFEVNIPDDLKLDSYPGPLGQVVTNFVTNAINHAFEKTLAGLFRIEAGYLENNQIQIIFEDNGCGMTPEQLKHVFEPFYTSKMGKGGSGLGMHLVYNIVTGLLGGTILIKSNFGEGTQITLVIPALAPQNAKIE